MPYPPRKLSDEERAGLGGVVCIYATHPDGGPRVFPASWRGQTWNVWVEGMSWDEMMAQFYSGEYRGCHPEITAAWREPDLSRWALHQVGSYRDIPEGGVMLTMFAPGAVGMLL